METNTSKAKSSRNCTLHPTLMYSVINQVKINQKYIKQNDTYFHNGIHMLNIRIMNNRRHSTVILTTFRRTQQSKQYSNEQYPNHALFVSRRK